MVGVGRYGNRRVAKESYEIMTKKQRALFNFIDQFIKTNGYAPSYREIMRSLDYKSVSTVAIHVENLIILGHLEKKDHSARSLVVKKQMVTSTAPKESHKDWLLKKVEKKIAVLRGDTHTISDEKIEILIRSLQILGYTTETQSLKEDTPDNH